MDSFKIEDGLLLSRNSAGIGLYIRLDYCHNKHKTRDIAKMVYPFVSYHSTSIVISGYASTMFTFEFCPIL